MAKGTWMISGDWVIRESAEESFSDVLGASRQSWLGHNDYDSFTDHAVYVLGAEAGKPHVTIFDPLFGRPMILQLSKFPGRWIYASPEEVEATWKLAMLKRSADGSLVNIPEEKKRMKYRPKGWLKG